MEVLRNIRDKHEALKKKIHGTRIPLSKNMARLVTAGYMSVPLVVGYFAMEYTTKKSNEKWQTLLNQDGSRSYVVPEKVEQRGGVQQEIVEKSREHYEQVKQHLGEHPGQAPRPM